MSFYKLLDYIDLKLGNLVTYILYKLKKGK